MSTPNQQTSTALNADDVIKIAVLSRLAISAKQADEFAHSLNDILSLMQSLQDIDTKDVMPMRHPFDDAQPLREDLVTQTNQRTHYQAIAPSTVDGLYLVPRVIE